MTYQAISDLSADAAFRGRLGAAVHVEAMSKPLANNWAADLLKMSSKQVADTFAEIVAAIPGLADKYAASGMAGISDADLLTALQTAWTRLGKVFGRE
jgi:hypothetical protein